VDMGCNRFPLCQWGDATSPISTEEPVVDMRKFGKKKNLIFSFFGANNIDFLKNLITRKYLN